MTCRQLHQKWNEFVAVSWIWPFRFVSFRFRVGRSVAAFEDSD